jgi:hypothetical protein
MIQKRVLVRVTGAGDSVTIQPSSRTATLVYQAGQSRVYKGARDDRYRPNHSFSFQSSPLINRQSTFRRPPIFFAPYPMAKDSPVKRRRLVAPQIGHLIQGARDKSRSPAPGEQLHPALSTTITPPPEQDNPALRTVEFAG